MKSIILFGYMCSGKTTVGKALAKSLGRSFYDLDWYIQHRYHLSISEVFANQGETYFRELERRMLQETVQFEDIVLACGGGTPCFYDNADIANKFGTTVYLKAVPETILGHLKISHAERPLLKGKSPDELREYVTQQIAEREFYYRKAQHTIDVDILDSYEKIEVLIKKLRQLLNV